jgi:hypothetical protein
MYFTFLCLETPLHTRRLHRISHMMAQTTRYRVGKCLLSVPSAQLPFGGVINPLTSRPGIGISIIELFVAWNAHVNVPQHKIQTSTTKKHFRVKLSDKNPSIDGSQPKSLNLKHFTHHAPSTSSHYNDARPPRSAATMFRFVLRPFKSINILINPYR